MGAVTEDILEVETRWFAAVARELRALDYEYTKSGLLKSCTSVTRNEAVDFLSKEAKDLGFDKMSEGMCAYSDRELRLVGNRLACHFFMTTEASSREVPELTLWAMLDSDQMTRCLRLMWVPKLISYTK